MVRKKQKIQSMVLGILFLALIGSIFIITYKKLNPREEEREEQSYIIREEENMKKIWEALEDSRP